MEAICCELAVNEGRRCSLLPYGPTQVELTPMAIAAGRRLSDRLFGGMEGAKADYTNVPVSWASRLKIENLDLHRLLLLIAASSY